MINKQIPKCYFSVFPYLQKKKKKKKKTQKIIKKLKSNVRKKLQFTHGSKSPQNKNIKFN